MKNSGKMRLAANGDRLWRRLQEMGEIGGTENGGCNRQALTDEDKAGRDLFVSWCKQAGCSITVDSMGNIFARRPGRNNNLPPVITGSHLDTQPTGGKYDGVYGVLAGVEVLETLQENGIETEHPIEVVVWTNEEGARFSPAMIGSGVWSGAFSEEYGHSRMDKDGNTIGKELQRIGYLGEQPAQAKEIQAAFELHIEQGPILEHEGKQIGIVSGVQGMRWYDLTIEGQPCHAGPTPMTVRKDPMMALGPILERLYKLADQNGPWARATFGDINAEPGARNTVPERIILAVDLRHPDQQVLQEMDLEFRRIVEEESAKQGVTSTVRDEWNSPAVSFNPDCIAAVRDAVSELGYSNMELFSGAGHDSVYVSTVAPTSMIFIPCEKGISHNEAENVDPEDVGAGCNVLLHAMLNSAGLA
ncbi:MAG: M20 family metallo-hydrolase [Amphritea sp.]